MKLIPIVTIFFALYAISGFGLAWYFRRNDLVDMMWGPGIAALAWIAYLNIGTGLVWIIPMIMSIWAIRLSVHIALRAAEKKEDARYAAWREEWMKKGSHYFYIRSFFQVFLLQGIFMVIVALPALLSVYFGWGERIMWWQIVGILVWIEGFAIESIADWQLSDFLHRKHAGLEEDQFMKRGIWAWSRHPNYFGEVEQWWGIFLIALAPQAPWTWLGILSPIFITYLILKVSGIPMLEAQFADNPEYQAYKEKVNAFIPWYKKIELCKKSQETPIHQEVADEEEAESDEGPQDITKKIYEPESQDIAK